MIAETIKSREPSDTTGACEFVGQVSGVGAVEARSVSDAGVETSESALSRLVGQLRADAANDPIQYLIRSNTACDGE